MKFTELNKNNIKSLEKEVYSNNGNVFNQSLDGYYLILDDKFIEFLNKM